MVTPAPTRPLGGRGQHNPVRRSGGAREAATKLSAARKVRRGPGRPSARFKYSSDALSARPPSSQIANQLTAQRATTPRSHTQTQHTSARAYTQAGSQARSEARSTGLEAEEAAENAGLPRREADGRRRSARRAPAVRAGAGAGAQGRPGRALRLLPPRQDPASAAVSGERRWSFRPEKGAACNGQLVPEDCEWRAWN